MASPLFLQGLLNDFSLQAFFCVHLLEPTVLLFEFLEPGHQGSVHATELAPPFVKRCGADAMLPAEFRNRAAALCLLEYGDDLTV